MSQYAGNTSAMLDRTERSLNQKISIILNLKCHSMQMTPLQC